MQSFEMVWHIASGCQGWLSNSHLSRFCNRVILLWERSNKLKDVSCCDVSSILPLQKLSTLSLLCAVKAETKTANQFPTFRCAFII